MNRKIIYRLIFILGLVGFFAYYAFPLDKRINLGLDLKGGMHLLLKVDTEDLPPEDRIDACDRALEVIRNRIDAFGVREPTIQRQGEDEIVVQLPGITERQRAIELIGKTALLEFKLVSSDVAALQQALSGEAPAGYELVRSDEDDEPLLIYEDSALTGGALSNAYVRFDQMSKPIVALEFNAEGARKFADITTDNVGKRLAIVLDGKVQSAPRIREAIPSGEAVISGRFSPEEAQDLAIVLRIGALPAPMHIEEERTIGPLLGQDSINKGIRATLIGAGLVLVFMLIYYIIAGMIADIALMLNLLLILGGLGILPVLFPGISATLTLPGIAGIALALGMAVDANVLINERIKEELSAGKHLRTAISNGYNKAFSAILDSNITTLIAAFLLFRFGTGPIRGFAVTLTIGLAASLFTAIVVTRAIFELLLSLKILKFLPMIRLFRVTKIDFIRRRRFFYLVSLVIIGIGIFTYFKRGPEAHGIDFVGGQLQEYSFKREVPVDSLRGMLDELKIEDASIQQFREDPRVVLIRTKEDRTELITDSMNQRFPDQDIQILRIERVGPVAGRHLKHKAIKALIWSLIGILVYVSFRFKHFNFAAAGVIALLHDVGIALAFLMITGRQLDLLSITAFLTIAGYSINDTIVIYDRVRENSRLYRKLKLYDLINLSVNQTLGRTVLTTVVTLLVVISIFLFGGEVLSNFAFALIVGFISGIYSTIYIASPLILAWTPRSAK